jgi:Ca-activated chloride channel homolog
MSFLWPKMLVLAIVGAPLIIAGYVALTRRRAHRAADLAAQGFVPTTSRRRRRVVTHLPFAFFLAAVITLLVAMARPAMSVGLPTREGTVILAFDVSNSMLATDLQPTRIDAAKKAARAFVDKQPSSIKIGVVAFSDGGLITQQPTNVKTDVMKAIDRLTPIGATSLGQGIFTALNAIAGKPIALTEQQLSGNLDDVDIGYYGNGAIVLLSDGENTSNPDALEVAKLASVAGVKIYPIGIGSPQGTVLQLDGFSVATALNEDLLTQIAKVTDGQYFNAQDSASLAKVYNSIDLKLVTEAKKTEVTAIVTGLSIALMLVGAGLSLAWLGRLV